MIIRPATEADHAAIHAVETAAFGHVDEADIVDAVRTEGFALVELVADDDGQIIGHILFNRMTCTPPRAFAGLAPVAVKPNLQNAGVGSALIERGIDACRALGIEAIVVLGHQRYYPRFGFSPEAAKLIASPYAGRPSFMAMALKPGALDAPVRVDYPAAFS